MHYWGNIVQISCVQSSFSAVIRVQSRPNEHCVYSWQKSTIVPSCARASFRSIDSGHWIYCTLFLEISFESNVLAAMLWRQFLYWDISLQLDPGQAYLYDICQLTLFQQCADALNSRLFLYKSYNIRSLSKRLWINWLNHVRMYRIFFIILYQFSMASDHDSFPSIHVLQWAVDEFISGVIPFSWLTAIF